MTDLDDLGQRIVKAAVLEGSFTLSSGAESSYYIDKYRFETRPDLLDDVTDALADLIQNRFDSPDRIAVPALGAVPLGSVLSLKLNKPFLIVRKEEKEYGTESQLEGDVQEGNHVVLVEDIVTTGGEAVRSTKALRENGLIVDGVACAVSREEGGEEALKNINLSLYPLFTSTELGLVEKADRASTGTG